MTDIHTETEVDDMRILAKGVSISNDTRKTKLNNNDLIIGSTGAGKTRKYVIPNILHAQESLIIADTKGNLRKQYGAYLEKRGYHVLDIDFVDMVNSPCGYNPLDYIHRDKKTSKLCEQDIMTVAAGTCPVESRGHQDPYWEQAAQMSASALIAYVMTRLPKKERTMAAVCHLAGLSGTAQLATLFKELDDYDPECFAASQYRKVHANDEAEKMTASVRGILINKLNPMSFNGARHLFTHLDRIDLRSIGREKTVVFLTLSDTDRSLDRLVNLFYTQALHELVMEADTSEDNRLPVPVRFILDDFATNTVIPDFDKVITTIRSRAIAVSLIVQDLSQLRSLYTDSQATTIENNCDTWLYLGGQDLATAERIAIKRDKRPISILNMPVDDAVVLIRGQKPRVVEKYDLESDDAYRQIGHTPEEPDEEAQPTGDAALF